MTSAYHRLFRTLPTYRWWKPIAAALLGFVIYFIASNVWSLIVIEVVRSVSGAAAATRLAAEFQQDQQNASQPLVLLITLGSLATMLPSVIVAVRILRLGSFGQLTSVVGHLRWRWMARCIVPAVLYMAITLGLGVVLPASWQGGDSSVVASGRATPALALFVSLVLIFVFVPFQAAGEEFAFRGLGMQAFGSWFRWPIIGILVPTIGFAFAHSYNWWGRIDVASLGIAFAYLAWRTGGLEAGIVGHVVNNVVVFALAAPVETSQQSNGTPAGAAISVVAAAAYVGMVSWQARRSKPERTAPELSTGVAFEAPAVGGGS